ncbi:MAG: tRNA (adenosine(37)-N6)-dimethylallyltransferase MiaA [Fimbriimonadaceae bacterium]
MPRLIAVMGPTASGKTILAEEIADRTGAQLVNADAFQVYKGLDIGTGKPVDKERYELLDICEPEEQFGVGAFVRLAGEIAVRCYAKGQDVVVVGGTGLYIRALLEGYSQLGAKPDPAVRAGLEAEEAANPGTLAKRLLDLEPDTAVDLKNPVRVRRRLEILAEPMTVKPVYLPKFRKTKIGLELPAEVLREVIARRVYAMLEAGWLAEVRTLIESGVSSHSPAFRAIGYRLLASVIGGETHLQEATERIVLDTVQYAKRQRTWLRSEPGLARIEMGSPFSAVGSTDVQDLVRSVLGRSR